MAGLRMLTILWTIATSVGVVSLSGQVGIPQVGTLQEGIPASGYVLPPGAVIGSTTSPLRELVERFGTDRGTLLRRWHVANSPTRRARLREFAKGWQGALAAVSFSELPQEGKIDYVLLENELRHELELLDREERDWALVEPLLPFGPKIIALMEDRRRMEQIDARAAAESLTEMLGTIERAKRQAEEPAGSSGRPSQIVAFRAAGALKDLQQTLSQWYRYYEGYDPLFTWWVSNPYKKVDEALNSYHKVLRERLAGIKPGQEEPIIGNPIGRNALLEDLRAELIAYTPEELIAIGEREFRVLEGEMVKASRELGFGDDWKAALEHVKTLHVAPGDQTEVVRALAFEAIDFIQNRDLITIPALARDDWRIEMLSPEAQRVSPFFLGGDVIQVAYPTDEMSHDDKLMSMRGNNVHFSRATVHHELIPGHHLQGYMTARYNPHRRQFSTPFWTEGWALWWEMLLWDQGFPRGAEDRVGMLFWRMHRAARIIFSLRFHLGDWTPQQAIDFLVDRVGHERANATAEVRRSFNGSYPPLYQVAYMMGGLQFRSLHEELVGAGKLGNREFHDRILKGGGMPVEMVRALLLGTELSPGYRASWRYLGDPLSGR